MKGECRMLRFLASLVVALLISIYLLLAKWLFTFALAVSPILGFVVFVILFAILIDCLLRR